jgi:hypothetical protein
MDAWILVLDTKGINVWCAAGKGTFGTSELEKQILLNNIHEKVSHRTIIVPQLGASNIKAHEIRKHTGFNIEYGPVRAQDIPAYLRAGRNATPEMRSVKFTWKDRLVLTPIELGMGFKYVVIFAFLVFVLLGFSGEGFSFSRAGDRSFPFLWGTLISFLGGAFITPLLLPIIPFRSFAVKGALVGLLGAGVLITTHSSISNSIPAIIFLCSFIPGFSSYLALNFTGATTFTNPSGVKREMKMAIPGYLVIGGVALVSLITTIVQNWRA